jgi:hypothetical protein
VLGSLASSGAGHRFYEIYAPAGPARGTMMLLHSGGWRDQRGDARRTMAATALTLRARGWRVLDVGYTPGPTPRGRALDPRPMLRDVVAFYDQVRRAYGGPICAYGESAGGHLAAMLALVRPSLSCAVLAAAPLDLRTLLRTTTSAGAVNVKLTFGTGRTLLRAWSPAARWDPDTAPTAVFATAASNDQVVPPQQLTTFAAVNPSADVRVVPGAAASAADAVPWMHSAVRRSALERRLGDLGRWLDREVPRRTRAAPAARAGTIGGDCAQRPARPPSQPRTHRWRLMLAGGAWRQRSTARQPIAATRGCSGSARWQDDGLSLWAFPSFGAVLPRGAEASLTLQSRRVVRHLSAAFRGFLARPQEWSVGLYASTRTRGRIGTEVAACEGGRCRRLRLVRTGAGSLVAAAGSHGDPDRRDAPLSAGFALPAGTRRLAWRLRCIAPQGCSLTGPAGLHGVSPRRRDPLGHPAILSVYRVAVR